MYQHILIPTDGTETALRAIERGIDFARESGARITFFTAVPEYRLPSESEAMSGRAVSLAEHDRRSEVAAEKILGGPARRAWTAGVACGTEYAQCDRPWEAIVAAAARLGCDAIFMATHGRKGLSRLMHGSQTIDVLTHSDIPTLVVR